VDLRRLARHVTKTRSQPLKPKGVRRPQPATNRLRFVMIAGSAILAGLCVVGWVLYRSGMPIEAQVYEAWIAAIAFRRVHEAPLRYQGLIKRVIQFFSGNSIGKTTGAKANRASVS